VLPASPPPGDGRGLILTKGEFTHKYGLDRKYSQQQISRALKYSKASLEIEGLFLTAQEERLLLERANGNMKYSEFLARAKEIAKNV